MTPEWKSYVGSTTQNLLDRLCDSVNETFDYTPAGPDPSIEALQAAMKAGKINKNPFSEADEKSIRHSTPHSFIYSPSTQSGKNFSRFDYRKADPPLYSSNNEDLDEAEILSRLNELLQKNELAGLGSAELAEVKELQKKVK